jgi:hypothetical protein
LTPAVREVWIAWAFQILTLKPSNPPCRVFGSLLMSSRYFVPLSVNAPLAIRLP